MKRKATILLLCLLATIPFLFAAAFASNDFLKAGENTTIKADEPFDFTVSLEDFKEFETYEIKLTIEPLEPTVDLDLKEDVDITYNKSKGTYTVSSDGLAELEKLQFTVRPDASLEEAAEYKVSAVVTGIKDGNVSELSESLVFKVEPKEEPTSETEEITEPTSESEEVTEPSSKSAEPSGESEETTTPATEVSETTETTEATEETTSTEETIKPDKGGFGGESGAEPTEPEYKGSSDNYLRSLSVIGHDMTQKFHKTRDTYFVDLDKTVSALDVRAVAEDKTATVDIAGNHSVSANMSKIVINVTAQNGDLRVYRIYVRYK